jgi:hypothetical protein
MPIPTARSFDRLAFRLLKERRFHQEALEEIDSILAKHGFSAQGHREGSGRASAVAVSTGAPGAAKGGRRRKRRSFPETAVEFVLGLLKSGKSMSTSDINKAWKASGRGYTADNQLTLMVKGKHVKRLQNKQGRGSIYTAA